MQGAFTCIKNKQFPLGNEKSNTHLWGKNLYNADDNIS